MFARSEIESTRKSPVQIIKEAQLKLKEELQQKKQVNSDEKSAEIQSEALVGASPASIESAKPTLQEKDDQIESEEEISVKSLDDVQTEVRARIEQEDLDVAKSAEPTVVYIVGKGRKYHLTKDCRGVKEDAELTELTLDEAIDKEYSLCGWEDK